jgi:NAD(P)H-dependent FMN reductase
MKKSVLAFGASNSIKSINKKLVTFTSNLNEQIEPTIVDLNDFPLPIFGVDLQEKSGIPENVEKFKQLIIEHDALMISFAEHNGAYAAVFKNFLDWLSRMEGKAWENKPMMLLATSPGARGGSSVLEIATKRFPFNGGQVIESFSLPSFYQNFDDQKGITNKEKFDELNNKLETFVKSF